MQALSIAKAGRASVRGGWTCVVAAAALSACGVQGAAPIEASGSVRAAEVEPGAAGGAALSCAIDGGATCAPLGRGDQVSLPARIKTTRGARARVDLGGGASVDLAGEASIAVSSAGVVTAEQGLVTVNDARAVDVVVLDHTARVGDGKTTLSVLAGAADRATITVRHGALSLRGATGAAVDLATGDSARVALGKAPDPREGLAAAPAPRANAPVEAARARDREGEADRDRATTPATPRGFGTLSARVPGTTAVVEGVRLTSHRVAVTIREGFARTEVEEEFTNTTARVLEGTYRFPVPAGGSLSRLALWVGKDLVEGEIVEKERAARIFKGIVDVVRPRDPALLEWVQGGAFSLKIFPIPAKGARKVVLAYDEALAERGGRTRYVYPLSLGRDAAVAADAFSITVTVSDAAAMSEVMTPGYPATLETAPQRVVASFAAERFTPDGDFEVAFQRADAAAIHVASYAPRPREFGDEGGLGYAAVRLRVDLPDGVAAPPRRKLNRAIAVDVSHSQSKETLADATHVARRLLRDLDADERFVVLACDSACATYPEDGLATASDEAVAAAVAFLEERAPGGSSDLAGALLETARRLGGSAGAQAVMIGDGQPTSGELAAGAIVRRVKGAFEHDKIDVRFLGAGRTVDEVVLGELARSLDAGYARVADGQPLGQRADDLAIALRRPLVAGASLTLPAGFTQVMPERLPSLALGDDVTVLARVDAGAAVTGDARLSGRLAGSPYALARAVKMEDGGFQNPIVPRLWAEARIASLEASSEKAAGDEVIALSKAFHVASRRTSLLVLENDRMFAAYGIERTAKSAGDQSDHVFGLVGGAPLASTPPEFGTMGVLGGMSREDPAAPTSPWGAPTKNDPLSARGNMWGKDIGESFGAGGLGLGGIGEGGSGRGDGIGLGSVGTLGHGASAGSGTGFGAGHGRLGGSHQSKAPQVRMGASSVSGRLPPEVIQRVVRQNFGRFRFCYETALAKDPNLAGRVSVRFIIGRDGSVPAAADGGSDIADANMRQCVINAFRGLSFPAPDQSSGPITVVYPLNFTSDGSRPPPAPLPPEKPIPPQPERIWPLKREEIPPHPTAQHRAGDERWRSSSDAAVAKARADAAADPASRRKRELLVRALLGHGQFDEARVTAEAFAEADPNSVVAGELLAEARAASGDGPGALMAVDAAVESAPRSVAAHARAARAFEAAGDERRACAHWRSLAEIRGGADDAMAEALRCRARQAGGLDDALAAARAVEKPGVRVAALLARLAAADPPGFEDRMPAGALVAKLTCASGVERCGALVLVTPSGAVVSPWTPAGFRAGASEIALAGVANGAYKTRLVGAPAGAKATVTVRALGATRSFDLEAKEGDATVAITQFENMEWGS